MINKLMACLLVAGLSLGVTLAPSTAKELKTLRDQGVAEQEMAPPLHQIDESGNQARAYRQQPPLIPHKVDKYQVDLKVNQCLRCHGWPYNDQFKAPKVSETHYVDRAGNRTDDVARTRWFCNQCHVPQTDAKPLVENLFQPAAAK